MNPFFWEGISVNAEITDTIGARAEQHRGWVLYDARCPLCTASVRRWGPSLRLRGYDFAGLQEEWVRIRLGLEPGELPLEMKLLRPDGSILGGFDAVVHLMQALWWLAPISILARLPGFHQLGRRLYRWIAENRYCLGEVCPFPPPDSRRRHAGITTFLELP